MRLMMFVLCFCYIVSRIYVHSSALKKGHKENPLKVGFGLFYARFEHMIPHMTSAIALNPL